MPDIGGEMTLRRAKPDLPLRWSVIGWSRAEPDLLTDSMGGSRVRRDRMKRALDSDERFGFFNLATQFFFVTRFVSRAGGTPRSRLANAVPVAFGRRDGYHNGRVKPRKAFLTRPRGDRDVETPHCRRVR